MQSLRIDIEGEGVLRAAMSAGEGCVLVGSHLGNFDAVRICGLRVGVPLKILMHTEQSPIMMSVLYGRHPAWLASLIPLGRADSFLQAHAALMAGDYVALLSDRAYREERSVLLPFLGAPALFPAGPMQLAAISGKPVVMFFGIYTGKGCYKVRFESLAGASEFAACERDVIVSAMLTRYVARLEVQCRRSPFNWFNFFDFWRDAIRAHD
jgi:predicted LPLAT superfamily acyltransferase